MTTTTRQNMLTGTMDRLVATDEGTHSDPRTVRVWETPTGERYTIVYHAGAAVSYQPTATPQTKGRLRQIK